MATIYPWQRAPFLRLLTAFIAGILLQSEFHFPPGSLFFFLGPSILVLTAYGLIPVHWKFRFNFIAGLGIHLLVADAGAMLFYQQHIEHQQNWFAYKMNSKSFFLATIEEPLVVKANSFKALASISAVIDHHRFIATKGKALLYFRKDSSMPPIHYGSQIVFQKPLQVIQNSNNPGCFDYRGYNHDQDITHQVFLSGREFILLSRSNKNLVTDFIFHCRDWLVSILRKFIRGNKETGLAEALLIGYKDDLDKALVQSYSNTGVVHIIAISGLHIGLIYEGLLMLTKSLRRKKLRLLRLMLVLSVLWLFSVLAGAQPSVLRSAVMFSFIALAEVAGRRTNIYNNLALSAFVLLCINPFWLWDVGFQLSYAAVTSIVLFFRPVYNWFFISNKVLDFIWKLNAVTISAQLLTLPLTMYHFHQLPVVFLFTNLVAVPLSSIILIGEIILCCIFFVVPLAKFAGLVLSLLIRLMNGYIEKLEQIPFSLWSGISVSAFQAVLLTICILLFCFWLQENRKSLVLPMLALLLGFIIIRTHSFLRAGNQMRVIIYNIPKHPAIDLIYGRQTYFFGDAALITDPFLFRMYLQPSRTEQRISIEKKFCIKQFVIAGKNICILDSTMSRIRLSPATILDLLVLSGNPKIKINGLTRSNSIRQVVIDGTVSPWTAAKYKKECESLHIPCHDVVEKGAFVLNL
ncbi:MAG: ComEC/Rec2 family competence protein [Flavisolibacter sp.]